MDIIVFPEYQKKGIATKILKDIQNGKLGIDFDKIQVSIDEKNITSIKLFENAGFVCIAKDEELLDYLYIKN
jgi:ribosomal protein S18 acetylase RimI-like enzyme